MSLSPETQAKANEIFQRMVSDPVYLVQLVWMNNPEGFKEQLRSYGFRSDVRTVGEITEQFDKYIQGDKVKGLKVAKLVALVPTRYNVNPDNITGQLEYAVAFSMFDNYVLELKG